MRLDGFSQVQVADTVPADDQEVLPPQVGQAVSNTSGGPQRLLLYKIGQLDAQLFPTAKVVHHCLGFVAQSDTDIGDVVAL